MPSPESGRRFAAAAEIGGGIGLLAAAVGSLAAAGIPAAVVLGALGGWAFVDGRKRWQATKKK